MRRLRAVYLGSWLTTPELVSVLVREIARRPEVAEAWVEIRGVIESLQRMIEAASARGDVACRREVPCLRRAAVYGALEEILTGWVLGQLPAGEEDVERAVSAVVGVTSGGLAA